MEITEIQSLGASAGLSAVALDGVAEALEAGKVLVFPELEFMLSVPPVPWGWKKQLIREAMRGRLPQAVVRRPKTPLALNARAEMIRRHGRPLLSSSAIVDRYVEPALLPLTDAPPGELMQSLGAYVFDHWTSRAFTGKFLAAKLQT